MTGKTTPHKGFRLPNRTLDELQMLVDRGVIRNFTEGVILAVEHLATEYRTLNKIEQQQSEVTIHEGRGQSHKVIQEKKECISEQNVPTAVVKTGTTST